MAVSERETILLVDDEKHFLEPTRDHLRCENFIVVTARSGEEALSVLEKTIPDLIILDVNMPGMGGLGLLKRLSDANGRLPYPVLMLTSRGAMREFFESVEVDGFIEKPCEMRVLLQKINAILGSRASGEAPAQQSPVPGKALLAEDDTGSASRIAQALATAGWKVETVRSGPEALERAPLFKPDILLLKEMLPNLNGSATAALINGMPSLCSIPVVVYDETRPDGGVCPSYRTTEKKGVRRMLFTAAPERLVQVAGELLRSREAGGG